MKTKNVFSRLVAWGAGLSFMLVFLPVYGSTLDSNTRLGLSYVYPYIEWQPPTQTIDLPVDNSQNVLSARLVQESNNRLLNEDPVQLPAVGVSVVTSSFLVEDNINYRSSRDSSREEWRNIKNSAEEGSVNSAIAETHGS